MPTTQSTTLVPAGPGGRRWKFMIMPTDDQDNVDTEENASRLIEPWGPPAATPSWSGRRGITSGAAGALNGAGAALVVSHPQSVLCVTERSRSATSKFVDPFSPEQVPKT
jgi:hypothetical protein